MAERLAQDVVAGLQAAPFTYPEVGGTASLDSVPESYRVLRRSVALSGDLDAAASLLLSWRVHEAAGLAVAASAGTVEPEVVVRLGIGVGPFRIVAPGRVVYVVEEPDRRGFAYGTLPGHPESGEELFLLARDGDAVMFTVAAFSRPASTMARLAGPATRRIQDLFTRRYLRALDRLSG